MTGEFYTSTAKGPGLIPSWGIEIPQTVQYRQKQNRKIGLKSIKNMCNDSTLPVAFSQIL